MNKSLSFRHYQDSSPSFDELLCPHCENNYLHHIAIDIFDREEDSEQGLHIQQSPGKFSVDTKLNGNPSSRRDGLLVKFVCESCHKESNLFIAQHKGNTQIGWRIM